eukprot:4118392-Prymnesium_polylepis.1
MFRPSDDSSALYCLAATVMPFHCARTTTDDVPSPSRSPNSTSACRTSGRDPCEQRPPIL